MSLSPATVQRLTELEAQPELAPADRGELRAMTHSRPSGDERARLNQLLAPTAAADGAEAYGRGTERAKTRPSLNR